MSLIHIHSIHTINAIGWVLAILGFGIFLIALLVRFWRIYGQYSSSMSGKRGLYVSALLETVARFGLLVPVGAIGIGLIIWGH